MLQEDISNTNESFERYKERLTNFSREFELGLFLLIIRRNIWWIGIFIILAITGAFLYLRYTPAVYESTSILQINQENKASKVLDVESLYDQPDISTEIELIRSRIFLKSAFAGLPLGVAYYNKGTVLDHELYLNAPYRVEILAVDTPFMGRPIFIHFPDLKSYSLKYSDGTTLQEVKGKSGEVITTPSFSLKITPLSVEALHQSQPGVGSDESYFILNNPQHLLNTMAGRVQVRVVNNAAKTVAISFQDQNAVKAADVSNVVAESYISYDHQRKSESARKVLDFIDSQLDIVYNRLKESETDIQGFKGINRLSGEKDLFSSNIERLTGIENDIMYLDLERQLLNQIEQTITKTSSEIEVYNLLPLVAGTDFSGPIKSMIESLHALLIKKEEMLFDVTPDSRNIKALDYQIEIQRKVLLESIIRLKESTTARIKSLEEKVSDIERSFSTAPAQEVEYARLLRLYSINEKFFNLLMEKRTEYSILEASYVPQNVILEKANVTETPVSPRRNMVFITFLMAAVFCSAGLVMGKYLLHNKITSLNEIIKFTNASVGILGIIPKYKKVIPVSQLVVDKNPKSIIAESFRTVRTNLQFINNKDTCKTIAVTSTISGEGKTFVAINLAGIIAYSGKRVIILDLDMRKPKIHLGFSTTNEKGMSSLLIGRDTLEDCIRKSEMQNLDFITAGPIPPNPSELIISDKMLAIIETLKASYDMIIIDTPPVGLVTDGITMISKADYPLYIFRADYSRKNFVQNLDRLVNENKIKSLSVVLNGVDIDKARYGYNAGYGYGYGYGYTYGSGYYDDQARKKKPFWKKAFK